MNHHDGVEEHRQGHLREDRERGWVRERGTESKREGERERVRERG